MASINDILNGKPVNDVFVDTTEILQKENISNFIDSELEKTNYYKIIQDLIYNFYQSGILFRSSGQCIAMSDTISQALKQFGIETTITECRLSVVRKSPDVRVNVIGFHNINNTSTVDVDTHVVCITNTKIPLLLDLSIGYIDPKVPFIIKRLENNDNEGIITSFESEDSIWTYYERKDQILPKMHQNSIVNRIIMDNKINKEITFLKLAVIFIALVTSFNFIRGSYDFYQKYVNKTNGFGPNKVLVDKNTKN